MNASLAFDRYYSDLAGEENAKAYKTLIFLAGSASAEFFADIGLCPFEAVKVISATRSLKECLCPALTSIPLILGFSTFDNPTGHK